MLSAMPGTSASEPLVELIHRRVVIVTGKGGVGKTTVASAIGRLGAQAGKRVLIAEMGSEPGAPSGVRQVLTGSDDALGEEPTELGENLFGVLLTPEAGHRAFLRDVLPLGFLADRALRAEPLKRFLSAAPAFAELGMLYRGLKLVREEKRGKPVWDLVVIDAPASGHALAFATLPEVALKIIPGGPIGRAVKAGHAMLTDPATTVALVTTLPETLPVTEALELVRGLEKSRVLVHGVVANLVPDDPFTESEHALLDRTLSQGGAPETFLGSRSLGRLKRARDALQGLRAQVQEKIYTVREHASRGPELVLDVARELAA